MKRIQQQKHEGKNPNEKRKIPIPFLNAIVLPPNSNNSNNYNEFDEFLQLFNNPNTSNIFTIEEEEKFWQKLLENNAAETSAAYNQIDQLWSAFYVVLAIAMI